MSDPLLKLLDIMDAVQLAYKRNSLQLKIDALKAHNHALEHELQHLAKQHIKSLQRRASLLRKNKITKGSKRAAKLLERINYSNHLRAVLRQYLKGKDYDIANKELGLSTHYIYRLLSEQGAIYSKTIAKIEKYLTDKKVEYKM